MFTALNILALRKFSTMDNIYKDIIMIDNNINGGMVIALKRNIIEKVVDEREG